MKRIGQSHAQQCLPVDSLCLDKHLAQAQEAPSTCVQKNRHVQQTVPLVVQVWHKQKPCRQTRANSVASNQTRQKRKTCSPPALTGCAESLVHKSPLAKRDAENVPEASSQCRICSYLQNKTKKQRTIFTVQQSPNKHPLDHVDATDFVNKPKMCLFVDPPKMFLMNHRA